MGTNTRGVIKNETLLKISLLSLNRKMNLDLQDSVANVKNITRKVLEDELKKIFDVRISIPPHGEKSLGVDTTRLFGEMKPENQYGHKVQMLPMQPKNSRYYSDPNRKQRQQDVVVTGISEITERRWRADIGKDSVIVLSVNKCPLSILEKRKDVLVNDLSILMKMVSSPPEINM